MKNNFKGPHISVYTLFPIFQELLPDRKKEKLVLMAQMSISKLYTYILLHVCMKILNQF